MRYWSVRHSDGSVTYHMTAGDDLSDEGISEGVEFADTGTEREPHRHWNFQRKAWDTNIETETAEAKALAERSRKIATNAIMAADKAYIYGRKHSEVIDWSRVTISLTDNELKSRFPFAYADAKAFGDKVSDAIARFKAGLDMSVEQVARLEAEYQASKAHKP